MRYLRKKRVLNAGHPQGFWGRFALRGMNKEHADLVAFGLRDVPFRDDQTVLDVGCGGGNTLRVLSNETNGRLFGADVSETSVKECLRFNRALVKKGRLQVTLASVDALPYADGFFDLVTAVETFYFWQDKPAALREICRVLKTGGRLIVMLDAYEDGVTDYSELQKEIDLKLDPPERVFSWLRDAGFSHAEAAFSDKRVVYHAIK